MVARDPRAALSPSAIAPYFILVALIHAAGVATLFDLVAAKLPPSAPLAIMIAQFPLIVLSGYFEGRLDYGPQMANFPLWMRISSKPVKLAFTFGFMYVAIVVLQTLHFSIGPMDPTPPLSFPPQTRAMWFAMFSVGMFFPFYLAATGILIPILRVLTKPLRALPLAVGAIVALGVGVAAGVVIDALATKTKLTAFVDMVHNTINSNPLLAIGVTLGLIFIPMLVGVVLEKRGGAE
jgi:hypothetical protein